MDRGSRRRCGKRTRHIRGSCLPMSGPARSPATTRSSRARPMRAATSSWPRTIRRRKRVGRITGRSSVSSELRKQSFFVRVSSFVRLHGGHMSKLFVGCCVALLTIGLRAQAPTSQNPNVPPTLPDTNPFSSDADIQQGSALFQVHCTYCHGAGGEGGRGADLTAGIYRHGGKDPDLYSTNRHGIPGTGMAPVRVTDDEGLKIVGF